MRRACLAIVSFVLGCGTPTLDPGALHLTEEWYGLYRSQGGESVRGEVTEQVPCDRAVKYGMEVSVAFAISRPTRIPIAAELLFPSATDPGERASLELLRPLVAPETWSSGVFKFIGTFKRGIELVNGEFEIRVFNPDDGSTLHSRTWEVSGCPEVGNPSSADPIAPPSNKLLQQTWRQRAGSPLGRLLASTMVVQRASKALSPRS